MAMHKLKLGAVDEVKWFKLAPLGLVPSQAVAAWMLATPGTQSIFRFHLIKQLCLLLEVEISNSVAGQGFLGKPQANIKYLFAF